MIDELFYLIKISFAAAMYRYELHEVFEIA